ncbi:MAG: GDP-fucose synthetase [Rhodospirillaceae bacterium]|nr:GDP-fucose synthetase [Rhodospirillaceae bacterium]|tara:strand:+ start:1440 stop:2369 length:930 start_codon:yes stop_codon:yes gene_type:complete
MQKNETVLVTGAKGLVGSAICDYMNNQGFHDVIGIGSQDCDLRDPNPTIRMFEKYKPRYVFHAAARVYGIMGNILNKGLSFYDNVMINTNVIEAARLVEVEKITVMGTGAIYPYPSPRIPLNEEDIFLGEPHPSENSYAHAKRAMLAMLKSYQESYNMNWAYIVSCNLYGPKDKFDTINGHVIPSLIKKFYDAKKSGDNVSVWGNGSAKRDFMYVEDTARVIFEIMRRINGPVNIGSGQVVSIARIVEILCNVSNMNGRVEWDDGKPNGQDYRAYDLSKINSLEFDCLYNMEQGLKNTWDWYVSQKGAI